MEKKSFMLMITCHDSESGDTLRYDRSVIDENEWFDHQATDESEAILTHEQMRKVLEAGNGWMETQIPIIMKFDSDGFYYGFRFDHEEIEKLEPLESKPFNLLTYFN